MEAGAVYPKCVLKVNLGCCKACVVNVKKLLSKIEDVHAVDVDAEKGLVTVSGKAHPEILVNKIRKHKKKAEVLSYENPKIDDKNKKDSNKQQQNQKNDNGHHKDKKDHFCPHDSDQHVFEDYVPPKGVNDIECRDPYCKIHHKKPIIHGTDYAPMVKLQPQPSRYRSRPPPPPVPRYPRYFREDALEDVYDRRILPQYNPFWGQRPPQPPPPPHYGYYRARDAYSDHY